MFIALINILYREWGMNFTFIILFNLNRIDVDYVFIVEVKLIMYYYFILVDYLQSMLEDKIR